MKFYKSLIIAALTAFCLIIFPSVTEAADTMQIITTIFPEYDWVMNILGENPAGIEVTQLLNNGIDLHSYQPTAIDIMKLSACDLFSMSAENPTNGWKMPFRKPQTKK